MDIAFCINNGYVDKLAVVITSILENHPKETISFYLFSSDLTAESMRKLNKLHLRYKNFTLTKVEVPNEKFEDLKLNLGYISIETYYRYLIADLLPNLNKILYLDADLIVCGDISNFYKTDFSDNYLLGVEDLFIKKKEYKSKINLKEENPYINAGVLLMNLKKMRQDNLSSILLEKTKNLADKIQYQDQDIINIVCAGKIGLVDSIYNFTTRSMKVEKKKTKSALILHYTGQNKPWGKEKVRMKSVWQKYNKITQSLLNRKIKVGLLIDEFFGGAKTAFGGYGFLARKYIARYLPDDEIQVDVLLGRGKRKLFAKKFHEDNVDLYKLPRFHFASKLWLKKQNYDIYLSIELTTDWVLRHEENLNKKLVLWIQDPRPQSAWENVINTMTSIKDPCFFNQHVYDTVNNLNAQGRVKFISQGNSLNSLARSLYNLPTDTPIQYLPNPIDIDFNYQFDVKNKKKQIVFLGRLEAQKRAWLFCEIAKKMPEYEFYVLGRIFRHKEENQKMLAPYMKGDIPNLHFMGHVDGKQKATLIRESRILCSTAIWEGIPISWLEALSYGTLLVSDLEREDLARRFGIFVGEILGDGFDQIDKFIPAIKELMENDDLYVKTANQAIDYIRKTHNIDRFRKDLKQVIMEELNIPNE